ncbi:Fungal specific transcription factor domain-containing protein 51 [Elsinoe fawcettii]|nr:Fungal specific transcription factor domain-containing protein 51 [Elsinoe fawcettii]
MNVQIVQGYTLIALYMLRAFKPNASYLYFSLAARSAYAIGLHRAEVNASFDRSQQKLRDKIWKSLRVFDLLLSCLLGRPPCISDADDTHRRKHQTTTHDNLDILEASLSLSVILEQVVVQVYTRKHISVKVAQFVSDQLKAWALVWLKPLMDALRPAGTQASSSEQIAGALQVVSSYLYSITLLARPFLIYDVYDSLETSHTRAPTTQVDERSKKKIADGAIDAAITLVTLVQDLITNDKMPAIAPGIVPWLFTASLVLGLGILGRYGHALTKQAQTAVQCLEYFGTADPHARQYASIVQVLVETSDEWIRRREPHFRDKLKQASSELFGLTSSVGDSPRIRRQELSSPAPTRNTTNVALPANMTSFQVDTALNPLSFPWSAEDDQSLQEFLRPTGPNYGFAMEDSFFPIDDSTSAFLTEDMT